MLETLRDIHDLSSSPVVLVGMAGIERKLSNRQQLSGRISQWVEFKPADLEDAATLAKHVCEVEIAPDLLSDLHTQAKGSVRLMIVGLARIEALAKTQDWGRVDSDLWANRKLFLSTGPGR
jgi:DNA transposition AAA+ family ATPase